MFKQNFFNEKKKNSKTKLQREAGTKLVLLPWSRNMKYDWVIYEKLCT